MKADYSSKFETIAETTLFEKLDQAQQRFVKDLAFDYRFTMQELRQVAEIALDLEMWGGETIEQCWTASLSSTNTASTPKKIRISLLRQRWELLKEEVNIYPIDNSGRGSIIKADAKTRSKLKLGLGFCPVASEKTRCCNLLTLDAVDNCGYNCSYCSIQSFFSGNQVYFDPDFPAKLERLELDPDQTYHIGTGQSSDSLMWGNSHGVLDALVKFAHNHPNVILELKTKSANVSHLLKTEPPANLICTWSLNPQTIIDHEEQGSASLEKRLEAALSMQNRGYLVGFHFHPMIHFADWEAEYTNISKRLQQHFQPGNVAMISLGTLTYTKPVIRKIRERGGQSKILKMPLIETDGKLSYPDATKIDLFSTLYRSFSPAWREQIFFYLCMENQRFWKPVFGHDYDSNRQLERSMKSAYMNKISQIQTKGSRLKHD